MIWDKFPWKNFGVEGIRICAIKEAYGAGFSGITFGSYGVENCCPNILTAASDSHLYAASVDTPSPYFLDMFSNDCRHHPALNATTHNEKIAHELGKIYKHRKSLTMMRYTGIPPLKKGSIFHFPPSEAPRKTSDIYHLLSCAVEGFCTTAQEDFWVANFSHMCRKGLAFCRCIYVDGQAVSTVSVTHRTAWGAIIGNVATHPKFRGRGYAHALIQAVCAELSCQSLEIFLSTEIPEFYNRCGWNQCKQQQFLFW